MSWIENSLRQDSNTTKPIIFLTVLVVQALTVTRQDQNKIRSYQYNVDACASRLLIKVATANPKKGRHATPLTPTKMLTAFIIRAMHGYSAHSLSLS